MYDIMKDRRIRWSLVVMGVIFLPISIYLYFNLPKIGNPVKTETYGQTTIRYWETEEEKKLAEKKNEKHDVAYIVLLSAILSIGYGIAGLLKISKKPSEATKYKDLK